LPFLAPLLFVLIAFFCFCGFAGLVVFALSWRKIALYLKARRERDLIAIRHYHSRLSLVISELLSRANEIDQQSKYLPAETEAEWSAIYEKLGRALVLMGDTLVIIKDHVDQKNVKGGREVTLLLCREAMWVSRRLLDFEKRLVTAEKLQLEQIKKVQDSIRTATPDASNEVDTCVSSTTSDGGTSFDSVKAALESSEQKAKREKQNRSAEESAD
jgi:hypothetical protein